MRRALHRLAQLAQLGLSGLVVAPMLASWGAEPITLPSGKEVEGLGAGWPRQQAKAFLEAAPIPVEQLQNLDMATAVRLANQRNPVVRQNFALAIGYNVLAVPLAMAGYVTPLVSAVAMATSSLIVISNSLRLVRAAR